MPGRLVQPEALPHAVCAGRWFRRADIAPWYRCDALPTPPRAVVTDAARLLPTALSLVLSPMLSYRRNISFITVRAETGQMHAERSALMRAAVKTAPPSRGASAATRPAAGAGTAGAAGLAGKSDVRRRRETAADTACRCCKRGRRVRPLARSPPRRRWVRLGSDDGWRRGDEASSPRGVHRIARRESSARSWSRPGDGGEDLWWSIPSRPRDARAE